MNQHTQDPPPPLRQKNPAIPVAVELVVMKALAKDPNQRFASVQAFATELDRVSFHYYLPPVSQGQQQLMVVQQLADTIYKVADPNKPSTYYAVQKVWINPAINDEDQKSLTEGVKKEVELLSGLKHPQISSFISSFQEHGKYYFVMEFVPGRNLEEVLEDNRVPLDEGQVIKWMMSICEALAYLHSRTPPVILEWMRLSDIMVTPEGDVRLIDLGTRRRVSRYMPDPNPTSETRCTGTISYVSPEILESEFPSSRYCSRFRPSARSDIYSLGAIIYHLLAYYEPDPIQTPQVGSILAKNPRLHTIQVDGKIVCPIERVIIKSMQQNPELRFQNANTMRTALEYCLLK